MRRSKRAEKIEIDKMNIECAREEKKRNQQKLTEKKKIFTLVDENTHDVQIE
jgi:hypothetical protein